MYIWNEKKENTRGVHKLSVRTKIYIHGEQNRMIKTAIVNLKITGNRMNVNSLRVKSQILLYLMAFFLLRTFYF